MSPLHRARWLIVLIGVGWGVEARADRVDWSLYLEPSGYKTPAPAAAPAPKPTPTAKVAKLAPKRQASKVAQRAPAKPKHKR